MDRGEETGFSRRDVLAAARAVGTNDADGMRVLLNFETPGESQRFLTATLDYMWALLTAFTADETVDPDETVDDLIERILKYMPID
jgi:hypothetical protein